MWDFKVRDVQEDGESWNSYELVMESVMPSKCRQNCKNGSKFFDFSIFQCMTIATWHFHLVEAANFPSKIGLLVILLVPVFSSGPVAPPSTKLTSLGGVLDILEWGTPKSSKLLVNINEGKNPMVLGTDLLGSLQIEFYSLVSTYHLYLNSIIGCRNRKALGYWVVGFFRRRGQCQADSNHVGHPLVNPPFGDGLFITP